MNRVNRTIGALVMIFFMISGCATVAQTGAQQPAPQAAAAVSAENKIEAGAFVVRAKRLTRLEKIKKEAVRKNDGDTVQVIAGTLAGLVAFEAVDLYSRANDADVNAVVSLAVTAAAAYSISTLAGWIYDVLTIK
ncbi:MAG: hypothetical protein LLG37_03805 [Spirochaetia bacterium]|nr:hypothetical protein [Spirochaetia bacterium]